MSGQNIGDLSGEILADRYECDRRLGKQAGRQTLLARDLKTQQQVVVKLLSFSGESRFCKLSQKTQDLKIQFADRTGHLHPNLIDWLEQMTEASLFKRLFSDMDKNRFFTYKSVDYNWLGTELSQ